MSINFVKVAISALCGAAMGVAYEGATWYMNDYYPVSNLKPEPEAFWMDKVSYDIFARLHKYRDYNRRAYRKALLKTDGLFVLEHALLTRAKPVLEDAIRAQTLGNAAVIQARNLLASIKKDDQPDVELIIKNLERMIDIHVANVREMCKNCPV